MEIFARITRVKLEKKMKLEIVVYVGCLLSPKTFWSSPEPIIAVFALHTWTNKKENRIKNDNHYVLYCIVLYY